ncbi:Energy-coupling factor transporter ATP-binding protein EcfA2 [uncultured Eubacterium sp.]|uniref:energy-coupling factor transporter ATPase n=1 Tax=Emergencia sp. TaxID=1926557 RepID=UPI000821A4E2|nr:Energy-coupling factor transporter ATP-binding protein EcfA2 [uncultured Eubacterium sp.]
MSIQVRNLSHIYSKGMPDEQLALSNINFDIYDGEIVGVIGHTGSGKSTLLQHLNGLLKPNSGTIVIGNTDITAPGVAMKEIRRRVGLVFQYPEYQLFEETVAQDVAFGPKNLGLTEAEVADRVEEALELVGLDYEDIKERSPFDLSGGQKRRVAIAGVIAMKPHVLILDEPTAGLDPGAHQDILAMIEEVHEAQNNIIIFVSHNMADVASLSDKVMVLDNGKLVTVGTPQEVFSQKERLEAIGLNVPPVTDLMHQIKSGGAAVNENVLTIKEAEEELYNYLQRKMI